MIALFESYWPVILVALVIGLIAGILLFRPRQRVRLTDSAPVRPHMAASANANRPGLGHEAEVTASYVLARGESAMDPCLADDLERLKGVGPKLAAMLKAHGLTRFDQIAQLTDSELERLDRDLGPFRGRLQRDRVVEQAAYLGRGDIDGFEQRFGKL
jgi:predicted flap endonuclease-1-like 5' DNA nuclease